MSDPAATAIPSFHPGIIMWRRVRGVLTLLGLLLVALGDWRLWSTTDKPAAAMLSVGCLLLMMMDVSGPERLYAPSEWRVASPTSMLGGQRSILAAAAIGLSVAVCADVFLTRPEGMVDWTLLGGWFVSMLLLLAAICPAPTPQAWERLQRRLVSMRWRSLWRRELTWFVLILLIASAARLLYPTLLYPVRGDEGYHRAIAQFFLNPPSPDLFTLDYLDDSRVYYVPQHLFMLVFGDGLGPARLYAGLWGVAMIPPAYLLTRELLGRRVAILSSLILAVEPLHVNYARQNLPQPYAVTLTAVSFYCFIRGLRTGERRWWIGCGMAAGIAQYGHTDARFIPIVIGAALIYELCRAPRRVWAARYNILWTALIAVLAYGPTFFYVVHTPSLWGQRSTALNIISSGWLAEQSRTIGLVTALWNQVQLNLLPILSASPPSDPFYSNGASLPPWAVPFAIAGFLRCLLRPAQRAPFFFLAWSIIVFVLGGVFVVPLFQSQHIIELSVPLAAFTGLGILWAADFWRHRTAVAILLALILTASGAYYYFVQYQPIPARAGAPTYKDDTITEAAYMVRRIRPDATIYFFDDPSLNYRASPQASWLSGDRNDVVDVFPGSGAGALKRGRSGVVFFLLPSRAPALVRLRHQFPGGHVLYLRTSHLPGHTLALIYAVGHPFRAAH